MPRQTTTPLPQLIYPRVIHLRRRLRDLIYRPLAHARVDVKIGPVHETFVSWDDAVNESYAPIRVGDRFSPASIEGEDGVREFPWTQRWFRVDVCLPPDFRKGDDGREEYCLYFVAHGEFTVYTSQGDVWCGIDPVHDRVPMTSLLFDGEEPSTTTTIWMDGGQWQTGFWFGLEAPTEELGFRLKAVKLQRKNKLAYEVYHDLSMLIEWVEGVYAKEDIPLNTENGYYQPLVDVPPSLRRTLYSLNQACDIFDRTNSLGDLKDHLTTIYNRLATPSEDAMKICHVGHAHMDLVWLWPERVTYQKIVHTYSNVLQLMDAYPKFTFTMSQPPLYYHIQSKHPNMALRIKKMIQIGRWEFNGALEVEADTQIPVGEGLVRCILHGQERIRAITGSVSDTIWIPDVFGYSQCLPQIFHLADVPHFFTTKILWSTITKFPHNSFVWVSPDGSSVLAHLSVAGYNGKTSMKEAVRATREYLQADLHDEVLCPSGYGDGGGGPSEDQIERSLRMQRSMVGETPACQWDTVSNFFMRLSSVREDLPVYRGELFLEYHRAVHTTQSDFKYNLRACERALQTREALRVISGNFVPLAMEDSWERYLFALFHDATPGSSIHSVYKELNLELEALARRQHKLALREWPWASNDTTFTFTIVNQLAWERFACVELPLEMFGGENYSSHFIQAASGDTKLPVQVVDGKPFASVKLMGLSAMPCKVLIDPIAESPNVMKATPTTLSNGIVDANFNENGQLCHLSINGKHLLLKEDEASSFAIHNDNPEAYDAWDMDHHIIWLKSNAMKGPIALNIVACGPIVSILRSDPVLIGSNGSKMEIEYRLYAGQDSLHVSCFVDWRESHKTLRYQVPTDYMGDVARFGAPFGFVDRSQIAATQKEEGQWEVPASRWASALNANMTDGISLVTEAKYGFRCKMGVLSVTLLRSSTFPDLKADRGLHRISFAITRHQHNFQYTVNNGLTVPTAAKADELYTGPAVFTRAKSGSVPPTKPPIQFKTLGSAVPSWTMPSKVGNGFLLRLHEVSGANTEVTFSIPDLNDKTVTVETVNFNERVLSQLGAKGSCYTAAIAAYKIVTLRISFKTASSIEQCQH